MIRVLRLFMQPTLQRANLQAMLLQMEEEELK